jgi:hypothetical protein
MCRASSTMATSRVLVLVEDTALSDAQCPVSSASSASCCACGMSGCVVNPPCPWPLSDGCLAAIPIFAKIAEAAPERVNLGSLRPPRGVQREALLTDSGDHFHNLAFSPGRK